MARRRRRSAATGLLLLLIAASSAALLMGAARGAPGQVLEGFEGEEEAAAPSPVPAPEPAPLPGQEEAPAAGAHDSVPVQQVPRPSRRPAKAAAQKPASAPPPLPNIGPFEFGAGAFLVLYILNVLYGRSVNAKLARAWGDAFAREGGIFDKNFSSIGIGGETLARVRTRVCADFGGEAGRGEHCDHPRGVAGPCAITRRQPPGGLNLRTGVALHSTCYRASELTVVARTRPLFVAVCAAMRRSPATSSSFTPAAGGTCRACWARSSSARGRTSCRCSGERGAGARRARFLSLRWGRQLAARRPCWRQCVPGCPCSGQGRQGHLRSAGRSQASHARRGATPAPGATAPRSARCCRAFDHLRQWWCKGCTDGTRAAHASSMRLQGVHQP